MEEKEGQEDIQFVGVYVLFPTSIGSYKYPFVYIYYVYD